MEIRENISIKPYNSFGIDAISRYFAAFTSAAELKDILNNPVAEKIMILGGGSNILFTRNFDGLLLKNELKGIELIKEDETFYYIKAAAGENWHRFVLHCLKQNYAGIENLSLIPGNIGASPIQNIGAYGVEIKDVLYELEAMNLIDKTIVTFNNSDCNFGYRESIFKNKYKNRFAILNVTFQLRKAPVYKINYGAIQQELTLMNISDLSIKAIAEAVIRIRNRNLPDPSTLGNAGSFFKNPVVDDEQILALKKKYPGIPFYTQPGNRYKVAAGWLIEECGWKGFRKGEAGCYEKQALVLINYGKARGQDIYELSEQIIESVNHKFGIQLEREVNIY